MWDQKSNIADGRAAGLWRSLQTLPPVEARRHWQPFMNLIGAGLRHDKDAHYVYFQAFRAGFIWAALVATVLLADLFLNLRINFPGWGVVNPDQFAFEYFCLFTIATVPVSNFILLPFFYQKYKNAVGFEGESIHRNFRERSKNYKKYVVQQGGYEKLSKKMFLLAFLIPLGLPLAGHRLLEHFDIVNSEFWFSILLIFSGYGIIAGGLIFSLHSMLIYVQYNYYGSLIEKDFNISKELGE